MLAYEPAKRLARLNIDLNAALVGVRILFEIIDTPADRADRRRQAAAEGHRRARRIRRRAVRLSPGRGGDSRHDLRGRARQDDRAGRAVRRRQVDGVQPDPAVLRADAGIDRHRRPEHRRRVAPLAAPADRLCRPGRVPVPRHDPRQHRRSASPARPKTRSSPPPRPPTPTSSSSRFPAGYDTAGRRARRAAFRRRAPARRDRARADQERADHPARRGDRFARFRIRAAGAGRDGRICARAAPPSRSRTGCTPSRMPTASWWSRAARSSNPAATTNCCARAAATPRSTGCRSRTSRSRRRRSHCLSATRRNASHLGPAKPMC